MISRKVFITMRKSLSQDEFIERNDLIYTNFLNAIDYKDKSIMSYCSINNEVDTVKINEEIISNNKKLILPKTDWDTTNLIPLEITSLEDISIGKFDIPEPGNADEKIISPKDIDIVIVPGVIFDSNMFRIGYGKGFYDRFLSQLRDDALKIGLAYDFQIIDDSHPKDHDIAMDVIICERGIVDL